MGKRIIITEEDKKHILGLYRLINEEDENNTPEFSVDRKVVFPAGYYNESYIKDILQPDVDKVKEYLTSNPNTSYVVQVSMESGESQIPNTDREKGGERVEPGYLSQERGNTIKNYVNNQFNQLVTDGILKELPTYNIGEPKIGETIWVGQDFCPKESLSPDDEQGYACLSKTFSKTKNRRPNWSNGKNNEYSDILAKYNEEQYIKLSISVNKIVPDEKPDDEPEDNPSSCLNNMTIELNYPEGKSGGHKCNSSVFKVKINGIVLTRNDGRQYASLNNGIKPKDYKGKNFFGKPKNFDENDIEYYDNSLSDTTNEPDYAGARYNKFIITPEIAEQLLSKGEKTFDISAQCFNPTKLNDKSWGDGCHKSVGSVIITNGNGDVYTYKKKTPRKKDEEVTLVKINACGVEDES